MVNVQDQSNATNSIRSVSETDFDFEIDEKTKVKIFNKKEAVLEETDYKVVIELLGVRTPGEARAGVDLVTVLDVSGSMGPELNDEHEDRLAALKIAMKFVIRKLSPIDRLSIITFTSTTDDVFPLGYITENSLKEIEKKIDDLVANGGTDILAGLQKGLRVLDGIEKKEGRVSAIMLMSDGNNQYDYVEPLKKIKVPVPVHTFGVGLGYNPEVLRAIADKSSGGIFSYVQKDKLSEAFSPCLAGLLTVAVQNLTLTLTEGASCIKNVYSGNYLPEEFPKPVNILFHDLYDKEKRTVKVDLRLPRVDLPKGSSELGEIVLLISHSYSVGGNQPPFTSAPLEVNVTRVGTTVEPERPEVTDEENRLDTVDALKGARLMAEENKFEAAQKLLKQVLRNLKRELEDGGPNPFLETLESEVAQYLLLLKDGETYRMKGRAYALSAETSHDRQRFAARGDTVKKGDMYSTPRMDTYIEQAKAFGENPDTPVPTADEDDKLEDPIGPTARALSKHLRRAIQSFKGIGSLFQTAIESLQGIDDIINPKSG